MKTRKDESAEPTISAEWPFPAAAALGSSVRGEGILREIRARLPFPDRKRLTLEDCSVRLSVPEGQDARLAEGSKIVEAVLARAGDLPVLPSEAEDILTISARERLKWTKDGRLPSAGTRTVKLRGRAKTVTFHVFDPRQIEDALDRDLPAIWREEDAAAAAEARRRAAGKAALTRAGKGAPKSPRAPRDTAPTPDLKDWDAFALAGLLR